MSSIIKDMKTLNIIFRKYNVRLWLNWGTLLGAIRDNKLLDDDIDLATINLTRFVIEFESIVKELLHLGFEVETDKRGMVVTKGKFRAGIGFYEIGKVPQKPNMIYQENLPVAYQNKFFAKKFYYGFMRNNPTNFKYFFFKLLGGHYITYAIPNNLICPLRDIKFFGEKFAVPYDTEKYLEYLYGKNWKTPQPDFPHFVAKDNVNYYKGTFDSMMVECPRCGHYFGENRKDQNKMFVKVKLHCGKCDKNWKQKVFIKGAVQKVIK